MAELDMPRLAVPGPGTRTGNARSPSPQDRPPLDDAQRRDLAEKVGYGSATTPPGDLTSPTQQTPRVSPNPSSWQGELKDSWRPSPGLATTWGPYFEAMFPPGRVTAAR